MALPTEHCEVLYLIYDSDSLVANYRGLKTVLSVFLEVVPCLQVEQALSNGSDVVLRIDVQGAATIRKLLPRSVHIFLVSPSQHILSISECAVSSLTTQRFLDRL